MSLESILTIIAIIVGPVLAVQVQKWIEKVKLEKNRKVHLFTQLMASRGNVLSDEHVQALNLIDNVFKEDKKVIDAWKIYFDNLSDIEYSKQNNNNWTKKNQDLLVELLYEMAKILKYDFDKVQIKRNAYYPQAFANIENENYKIRQGLLTLLDNNSSIKVNIDNEPNTELAKKQEEYLNVMIKYYKNQNNDR